MYKPKLIKLSLQDGQCFYCLEELPSARYKNEAVILLHGLGENRAGINYLFTELSEGIRRAGYAVYRFDLGGCGESLLPLSLQIWKQQIDTILTLTRSYRVVHMAGRGISSVLLFAGKGKKIAIGPMQHSLLAKQLPKVVINSDNWVSTRKEENLEEESFWYSLGVEAGCLFWGALGDFMNELNEEVTSIPGDWSVVWGGRHVVPLPAQTCHLTDCHPLFLYQADRQILLKELVEILND